MKADIARATSIAKQVVKAYKNNQGVFAAREKTEGVYYCPVKNEKTRNLWEFFTVSLDYQMSAAVLYKGAQELVKEKPEYYDPLFVAKQSETRLTRVLREYLHPRFPREAGKRWKAAARLLVEKYDGNPAKIFQGTNNALQVMNRIYEFRGFGPKIGNLYFRIMAENGYCDRLQNIQEVTVPVDSHYLKLSKKLKITETNNVSDVRQVWSQACKNANVRWIDFDNAFWFLAAHGETLEDSRDLKRMLL